MSDVRRMELTHLGPGELIEYALVLERQLRDHIGVEDELKQKLIRQSEICFWTYDPDGYYDTTCGKSWAFNEGNLADNEVRYCHNCGRLAVEVKEEEEDERD